MLLMIILMIFRQLMVMNKEKVVADLEELANDPVMIEEGK